MSELIDMVQRVVDKLKPGERVKFTGDDGTAFAYYHHPEYGVYLETFKPAGMKETETPTAVITITVEDKK